MSFIDFALDENLQDLRDMVRDFTDKEVRPLAEKMDQENYFPAEIWKKMADMGLFGLTVGEEYGGNGLGYLALAVTVEEMTKGAGIMFCMLSGQNGAFSAPIIHLGTPEQKEHYMPSVVSGDMLGAFALTEPATGSDARNIKTTAVLTDGNYIINGSKVFISNADHADFIITFAKSADGPVALIHGKDLPGLTVGPSERKMGLHGIGLNPIYYDNVVVPQSSLLGKPGDGFKVATASLAEARMAVGAASVGMAQEAIDLAVEYSKQRIQFGKRISEFQNTQFVLAECQTKVEAARFLVYRSAVALDQGNHEQYMSSMAKYYASEICNDVARKCLQVFGGSGFCSDYAIERIYRDVKVWEILDGTTEIHKHIISKWMDVR